MRLFEQLCERAGMHSRRVELAILIFAIAGIVFLLTNLVTSVLGLAMSLSVLWLGFALELLRLVGSSRQLKLDRLWPQVFDSFENATQSGLSLLEQLEYLAEHGPERLKTNFQSLGRDLDKGQELSACLAKFRAGFGSRHADQLALLIEITTELGTARVAESWRLAATGLRAEQAMFGEVTAKTGWVLGSAKVALAAPWLVAFVLINLEQNRQAFQTELGALVLLLGLALSVVAYAVVNKLGSLAMPGRVFNAIG